MINKTFTCGACRKEITLDGRGGAVWVRGEFQFCSKECYETLERCGSLLTDLILALHSDLNVLEARLRQEGLVTHMHRSYMLDFWEGERNRIEEAFWKHLEDAAVELERKRTL